MNLKILKNRIFYQENKNFSIVLNIFLVIYAALLPMSGAFSTHTGPYILLLLWILEGDLTKKFNRIKSNKPIMIFFALFLLYLLSFLWTENFSAGLHSFKYYISIITVMVIYYTSAKSSFLTPIIAAFLISMAISELLSYGIFLEFWSFGDRGTPDNPTPFMHHIKYSIFLGTTIFLLIWQIKNKNTPNIVRFLEFIFLISATVNLFINGGRTGQIGLIFATIVYIATYYGMKLKYILSGVVLITFIFFSAYYTSPIFNKRVQMGVSDVQKMMEGNLGSSWGLRVAMKIIGYDIVKESPFLGVGIGDVFDEFQNHLKNSELKKYYYLHHLPHVHDQFLQTTIQVGIVGLLILIYFFYSIFKMEYHDPLIKSTLFAILTIIIFSFFTEASLRNNTSALLAFILGYLWNKDQLSTQSDK